MSDPAADARRGPPTFERACGGLTHPIALAAVALLAFNDHVFKGHGPAWLTGKLSDFAGLAFFPLLLEALAEGAAAMLGRFRGPSLRLGAACVVATAIGFAWVKLTPSGGAAYGVVLGLAQAPFRALSGEGLRAFDLRPETLRDPSDLLALLALGVPATIMRRRHRDAAAHGVD